MKDLTAIETQIRILLADNPSKNAHQLAELDGARNDAQAEIVDSWPDFLTDLHTHDNHI